MDDILLPNRYGYKNKLIEVSDGVWKLQADKNLNFVRYIHDNNELIAIDLEGGPYISVESTIKNITISDIILKEDAIYFYTYD